MKTLQFPAVGTYMTNRVETPKLENKQRRGESEFAANNHGTLAMKWQDTKAVHVLSNCHTDTVAHELSRRMKDGTKVNVTCPATAFYNKFMGGVDRSDQSVVKYHLYFKDAYTRKNLLI